MHRVETPKWHVCAADKAGSSSQSGNKTCRSTSRVTSPLRVCPANGLGPCVAVAAPVIWGVLLPSFNGFSSLCSLRLGVFVFTRLPSITMADEDTALLMELPGFDDEAWGEDEPEVANRREVCAGCAKPAKVCLCSVLPVQKLRTPNVQVLVLQHPEEAGAAKGTVKLIQLCLADCRVVTGRKFRRQDLPAEVLLAAEQSERARTGIMDASTSCWQRTILLWPSPDAEDLEQVVSSQGLSRAGPGTPPSEREQLPFLLVLLDGTWPSCGQMLQKSVCPLPALLNPPVHRHTPFSLLSESPRSCACG